ncbi:MAG: 16S rRNA (cytosine(1402)-N(4))-methyltransferase RsmH [Chitinophagaceae bacterium]|nr:16S rRNA (cytosine(1402)-N(4))-methyltransferase RsmH [Chitinophagaceae bacterium]
MNNQTEYHIPVLLAEATEALRVKLDGIYVDCTFGGGGHSKAILSQLGPKGKLFVFDQDETAKINLPTDKRVEFVGHNFRHIGRMMRFYNVKGIDGILADLGVSSHQFDEGSRGFSIRFDAALDMRMDKRQPQTAATVLQESSEETLHKIFERYGEVTNSKTLAKTIVNYRQSTPLTTTQQFKNAVHHIVKGNPHRYFAQVFQALRIAVNDEFGALEELLTQLPGLLNKEGRVAIITFHSLEDRMVKNFFKSGTFSEAETDEVFGTKPESPFHIITKKPIAPTNEEQRRNPRSRSAKLRIAEKIQ